jgi:hypothetical protein
VSEEPTLSRGKRRSSLSVELAWFLVPVVAVAVVLWNVHSGGPYSDAESLRERMRSAAAFTLLATSFAGFLYFSVRLFSRVLRGELFRIPADPGRRLNLRGELAPLVAILGTLLILWIILQLSQGGA